MSHWTWSEQKRGTILGAIKYEALNLAGADEALNFAGNGGQLIKQDSLPYKHMDLLNKWNKKRPELKQSCQNIKEATDQNKITTITKVRNISIE